MDLDAHLRETARHLVWMANLPGQLALAHSKHRALELIASSPLYANLAELVMEERSATTPPAVWASTPQS
jgi:hypothetical protein